MDSTLLLSAQNVSKSYEASVSSSRLFFEALFGVRGNRDSVDALKPMNVDIHRGSSVGILGRNGAGKSTLLSILAGHIPPSSGTVTKYGRVAALVGIGQHFNINESGRYNAAQFCRIQGVTGGEAKEMIARIEEFAEIGSFFDRPVKTYSSGMRARLSFSCATFVNADLIIVDEVLAVGDAEFRSKCYGHIESSIDAGQTYILVSHSPAIIGNYCSRALVLKEGQLVFDGDPLGGMQAYENIVSVIARRKRSNADLMAMRIASANGAAAESGVQINSVRFDADTLLKDAPTEETSGEVTETAQGNKVLLTASETPATLTIRLTVDTDIPVPRVAAAWRNSKVIVVAANATVLKQSAWKAGESYDIVFSFTPRFVVGAYLLRFTIADYSEGRKDLLLEKEGLLEVHVIDGYRAGLVDLGFSAECRQVSRNNFKEV